LGGELLVRRRIAPIHEIANPCVREAERDDRALLSACHGERFGVDVERRRSLRWERGEDQRVLGGRRDPRPEEAMANELDLRKRRPSRIRRCEIAKGSEPALVACAIEDEIDTRSAGRAELL